MHCGMTFFSCTSKEDRQLAEEPANTNYSEDILLFPLFGKICLSFKMSGLLEGLHYTSKLWLLLDTPAPALIFKYFPGRLLHFIVIGWTWLWVMLCGWNWSNRYQDITGPLLLTLLDTFEHGAFLFSARKKGSPSHCSLLCTLCLCSGGIAIIMIPSPFQLSGGW